MKYTPTVSGVKARSNGGRNKRIKLFLEAANFEGPKEKTKELNILHFKYSLHLCYQNGLYFM